MSKILINSLRIKHFPKVHIEIKRVWGQGARGGGADEGDSVDQGARGGGGA